MSEEGDEGSERCREGRFGSEMEREVEKSGDRLRRMGEGEISS